MTRPWRMRWDLRGFVVPLALVCLAEIVAFAIGLQSDSVAPPSQVIEAAIQAVTDGTLARAAADTLICAIIGLLVGFLLGLALGLPLGLLPLLNHLLEFTIEAIRPIPSIALIPVALVAFGFGYRMEIAIVAFATMWPTLILSRAAVANIEPRLLEVARMLRLGAIARIFKIVIPAALPRIFIALRLAVGVALVVAVTVEITGNTLGVGYNMMQAQQSLRPELMLAFLFWVGFLGWTINALMLAAQKHLFGRAAVVEATP